MKKILITGASGFIGSFLVEEALSRNYKVFAGVRSSSNRTYLNHPDIVFFETDKTDKYVLKNKLIRHLNEYGKFDYIIHNAGITKSCNQEDFEKVNYHYTKNLIGALSELNIVPDKFVYMSSLASFGPGNENTLKAIQDADIPNPISLYGKSKLKAEQFINSLNQFPYLIFRPTGVYGPREKDYYVLFKTLNKRIETFIESSDQYISIVYVKDLARLVFDALESSIINKSYFVSDLENYTTSEFNNVVKKELNKKTIPIVFPLKLVKLIAFISEKLACISGKPSTLNREKLKEIACKNWRCDSSETVKDFGFRPAYNLHKGINETISWYRKEKLL